MRRLGITAAIMVPILVLAVVTGALVQSGTLTVSPLVRAAPMSTVRSTCPFHLAVRRPLLGVAPGAPWLASVRRFSDATDSHPTVIESYIAFGQPFDAVRACQVIGLGAYPLIQINPKRVPLSAIVTGHYDRYLRTFAQAVHRFTGPVILSFAHEMNGPGFRWGYRHVLPAAYIAAWRHVHQIFAATGDRNIVWLWDVNRNGSGRQISPIRPWWPGSRYVNWVGLDIYFNRPVNTFRPLVVPTLHVLRRFTHDPLLITETAVAPGPTAARQVRSLFTGVRARGLVGFVWFNINARFRWHIELDPAAEAVFKHEAAAR